MKNAVFHLASVKYILGLNFDLWVEVNRSFWCRKSPRESFLLLPSFLLSKVVTVETSKKKTNFILFSYLSLEEFSDSPGNLVDADEKFEFYKKPREVRASYTTHVLRSHGR